MSILAVILKPFALVFFLVGLVHLTLGPGAEILLGADLPERVAADPVLDSQNRFYGVTFMIYGALFWLCAGGLQKYATVFRLTCVFFFLGGLARLVSIAAVGVPTSPILFLAATELIGGPALLWWHASTVPRA